MLETPEVNGARQELPCLESPEINGARQEVGAVEKYVDGAWVEVWSSGIEMSWEFKNFNRNYDVTTWDNGMEMTVYAGAAEYLYLYSLNSKDYENPTISFDWYGGGYTGSAYTSAGTVYVVGFDGDGNEIVKKTCGTLGSSSDDTGDEENITLDGTFYQIAIKVMFKNSSSQGSNYMAYVDINNIVIDGKKCKRIS